MAEMKQLLMLDSNKILCDEDRYWQSRLSGPTVVKFAFLRPAWQGPQLKDNLLCHKVSNYKRWGSEEFQSTLFPRTCNIQSCLTKFIKNERLVQNMVSRWRHDDVIGSFLLNRCFSFLSELEVLLMIEIFWTWMGLKLIPTFAPALRRSFLSYELLIADGQRVWVLKCSTLLTTDKYRANFLEHSQL